MHSIIHIIYCNSLHHEYELSILYIVIIYFNIFHIPEIYLITSTCVYTYVYIYMQTVINHV